MQCQIHNDCQNACFQLSLMVCQCQQHWQRLASDLEAGKLSLLFDVVHITCLMVVVVLARPIAEDR